MIDLSKPVRRLSRSPFRHYRRRIVVILEPGDILEMRLERSRTTYRAPLATVFQQLVARSSKVNIFKRSWRDASAR